MELIGTVVRLQVQRARLKPGDRGARRYDPAPLLEVDELQVGPRGCLGGTGGGWVVDVHHADHPHTRNTRLTNGISVLPRAHYALMRSRFGDHLVDGSAGESLLLDTERPLTVHDLRGELRLEDLPLVDAVVASPCVEFARFALDRDDLSYDDEVDAAMGALDGGVRGFYLRAQGAGSVQAGARLWRVA